MLTIVTTSRRQGAISRGIVRRQVEAPAQPAFPPSVAVRSRSAKRRADEQKPDTSLSSRVEQAQDCDDRISALYGRSGGCVATVHVLIRGELFHLPSCVPVWLLVNQAQACRRSSLDRSESDGNDSAACGNACSDEAAVSRGRSSPTPEVMFRTW
jgi:hypothetical protein